MTKKKKPGFSEPMSKTDALVEILKRRGKLTPANVVEEAKNPKHPLHTFFCWDDTVAARKYREIQAAHIIRECKCVVMDSENAPQKVRVFHHVDQPAEAESEEAEGSYVTIDDVVSNDAYMEQVKADCRRDLEAFVRKYRSFEHLSKTVEAIDRQLAVL